MTPSRTKHSMFCTGSTDEIDIDNLDSEYVLEKSVIYESPTKWNRKITYSHSETKSDPKDAANLNVRKRRRHDDNTDLGISSNAPIASVEELSSTSLENPSAPKRARYNPKRNFIEMQDVILEELMRCQVPQTPLKCIKCCKEKELLRCIDCFHMGVKCQSCILDAHRHLPTHRIKYFDGYCWKRTSLRDLGLIVHLGHDGNACPCTRKENSAITITVLDSNGIHEVSTVFCGCGKYVGMEATEMNQALKNEWYPATKDRPRTVATFNLLDQYDAVVCEGSVSAYHYYKSLVRITDATESLSIPKRYEEFVRMNREYQHLKMIQRAGRTFESIFGVELQEGDLAVECPACPHPGRNLPEDWEKKIDSWVYTLFVMLDANFRLKLRRKNIKNDVRLGDGLSYYVSNEPYKEHLRSVFEEKDIKYCESGLRAVDHANLKGGRGYISSGVFACQCRHMTILPNGVGDLQFGERQGNADYILLSAVCKRKLNRLVVSYDIACQYCRKFSIRMSRYPENMQLDLNHIQLEFVIPQFHIVGHGGKCRTRYSLRFREHMGRTDGENIERGWASFNSLSMATKEMGRGAREDTLDHRFGDWNFRRILSYGSLFSSRLREAAGECIKHSEALAEFRQAFPAGIIEEIERKICKWNADPDHPSNENPYAEPVNDTTFLSVRKLLAEMEKYESSKGDLSSENTSAAHWLAIGIELEDLKYSTRKLFNGLKIDKTTVLSTTAVEKNAQAIRRIRAWKNRQILHMPLLLHSDVMEWIPDDEDEKNDLNCWDIGLQFPSSLTADVRKETCADKLVKKEIMLRKAAAYDSLSIIRSLLQKIWWLTGRKRKHAWGTGQKRISKSNTAILSLIEERVAHTERYRRNRKALLSLQPEGLWRDSLKALDDCDIRTLDDDEGKGEGRRVPSWIWRVKGAASIPVKDVYNGMRVEYAKSRARALRWSEETELVKEEMRRILSFFNWKIDWWMERARKLTGRSDDMALGFIVYANQQVFYLKAIGERFRNQWIEECSMKNLPAVGEQSSVPIADIIVNIQLPQFKFALCDHFHL